LNRAWQLLPGFIVWKLWKERNKRIFHSQPSPPTLLWNTILLHLKETLQLHLWIKEYFPADPGEISILNSWGFPFSHSTPPHQPPLIPKSLSPSKWLPPRQASIRSILMVHQKEIQDTQAMEWSYETSWAKFKASLQEILDTTPTIQQKYGVSSKGCKWIYIKPHLFDY
jgi:hypothetical protein